MSRPAFVFDTDDRTPPLLRLSGAMFGLEKLPVGTQVIFPAEGEPSADPNYLTTTALEAPLGAEPLSQLLRPGSKVTLVFSDNSSPNPKMQFDIRSGLCERILELCARSGVDDVALVCANGLHRRLTGNEFVSMLGSRVVRSFWDDGLLQNHDVMSEDLVEIGQVDGHPVKMNARVAESDLVISLFVRQGMHSSAGAQLVTGLTDVATIDYVQGLDATQGQLEKVSALINERLNVFAVEVILGAALPSQPLRFIAKREWEWRLSDQARYVATRQLMNLTPRQASQRLVGELDADYATLDIIAGDVDQVCSQSKQVWRCANSVDVPRQADVLLTSIWAIGSDATDPTGSPLAAAKHALLERAGSYSGKPFTRPGGVLVAFHPLVNRFSNRHHSASADFFADVLAKTTDPEEIRAGFQDTYSTDDWYAELYRRQHAFHPLQVFHDWYRIHRAGQQFSDVIWVGANRDSAARMGHRAATTLGDAFEIAASQVGDEPRISFLHGPDTVVGEL